MNFIIASAEPNRSLVILVTGFTVVLMALVLLILVIKIYGAIVSFFQNKSKKKAKTVSADVPKTVESAPTSTPTPTASLESKNDNLETIAVITAAVEAYYDKPVRVVNVKRSCDGASLPWYRAGVMQNITSRRGF